MTRPKRRPLIRSALACILISTTIVASCNTSRVSEQRLVRHVDVPTDTDCDGIADEVELKHGLDPEDPADATADPDGDDIRTIDELALGSDPFDRDTDHDDIPDGIDLEQGTDVDGDGVAAPFDDCPQDANADQLDADGDGVGDACDDDLPRLAIAEAWGRTAKDYALLPLAGGTTDRALADRVDLMPMPSSFRILATGSTLYGKVRPLYELWHPTTGDHAYVTSDVDRGSLIRRGYSDLGVLGYLGAKAFPVGHSVVVRRFVNATTQQEAVTVDPATAQALLTDGFVEQAELGHALEDAGHLRRPRPVVRYLRPGKPPVFRHQATPIAEPGYTSDGTRFAVLPERIAGALPLYRLRSGELVERLSTDAAEVAALRADGYLVDGIVGWILADPKVLPMRRADELWRLERDGEHRYALDRAERDALAGDGWVETKLLGYAFPATDRAATCAGPSPVAQLEDKLRAMAAHPDERAAATLTAIVASCALIRVIDGAPPANAVEKTIADRLPADPEVQRRVRASAARWDQLDPKLRADALGKYRDLDPGACAGPVDVGALRAAVADVFFSFSGPPPSLRESFCDGTLYAPTDPAAGTAAESRAVTTSAKPVGEFDENRGARPRLDGVLRNSGVRGHTAAEAFATQNPDIGYSLDGVDTGIACSPTIPCATTQGLRCEGNTCKAYPIVRAQTLQTFTGTNFWDVIDGHVVLREVGSTAETRLPDEIATNEPPDDTRCSTDSHRNRATIENPLSVAPDRFYEVEVRNTNGMYYEHDEEVPFDEATARANGRTVHLCWRSYDPDRPADTITDCTAPSPFAAACPLDGPVCGPGVGGTWGAATGARPRSLAYCRANNLQCGETPRELSSRGPNERPKLIFVEREAPTKRIVTSLQGVTCHNETGWDWAGSDELAVLLTTAVGAGGAPTAPSVNVTSEAWTRSFDSGDRVKQLRQVLGSVAVEESADQFRGAAAYMLTLMEDDFSIWSIIVGAIVIAVAVATVGWLFPALASISQLVGVGALLFGIWTGYIYYVQGPDDLLGRDAWWTTVADVTDRGAQSHGPLPHPVPPQLPQFPGIDLIQEFRGAYEVSVHPAVDNVARQLDSEITGPMCTQDSQCGSNKKCAIGICVPSSWVDLEPGPPGGQPGFLERRELVNGDHWRYDIYLGWHVEP